jgi:hypothetical protein
MDNFNFGTGKDKLNKVLNLISLIVIIVGLTLTFIHKNPFYFGVSVIALSFIILIHSNSVKSTFEDSVSNGYSNHGIKVISMPKDNVLHLNHAFNLGKGDIIALQNSNNPEYLETHIVSDLTFTNDNVPVVLVMDRIRTQFIPGMTNVLKVSDVTPNIITPPNGNVSISKSGNYQPGDPWSSPRTDNGGYTGDLNASRHDWNLELSTMVPGLPTSYTYQGPPYGPLRERKSTIENPMGTINVTEYDNAPTFYGTANVGDSTNGISNDTIMTENQEATLSMRVNDLLFHKGNAQAQFSPMAIDTLPNNQEAFANFCYRSPTNLVNVKYGSIFVNDPEKFKLVTKLAKATGVENGGGGR